MRSGNRGTDDPGKRINILHRKIPFRRAQQEIVYAVQWSGAGAGGPPTTRLPKSDWRYLYWRSLDISYRICSILAPNTTLAYGIPVRINNIITVILDPSSWQIENKLIGCVTALRLSRGSFDYSVTIDSAHLFSNKC